MTRCVKNRFQICCRSLLALVVTAVFWVTVTPPHPLRAQEHVPLQSTAANAYLELSVEPPIVLTDTLITLSITYHNIGFPYTTIQVNPPNLAAFEPPMSMPCKYDQHPNGCTAISLRTQAIGVVQFTASATGEVYDETCHCWYWSGASDNGPARLIIAETLWQTFLPSVHR